MNRIRQPSSVQDYVDRFSELVDQLKAYDSSARSLQHITHFMDGLFAEIRSVILVQRPDSLDTAYTPALLQEEAMDSNKQREYKPWNQKAGNVPHPHPDRHQEGRADRPGPNQKPMDKKLADLKAYRRARGCATIAVRSGISRTSVLIRLISMF
jgi:hypothetical protein